MPKLAELQAQKAPKAATAAAVAAAATARRDPSYLSSASHLISNYTILRACEDYLVVDVPMCKAKLRFLELFLSISSSSSCGSGGPGGVKRSHNGAQRHTGFHEVSGIAHGVCLGSIVNMLHRATPRSTPSAIVHSIQNTLVSSAMALRAAHGADVELLKAGLAAGHACRGQLLQIDNRKIVGKLHTRHGNAATVLGCAVAVLGIAAYLVKNTTNFETLEVGISQLLQDVDVGLHLCVVRTGGNAMSKSEIAAIQAEQRAVQRARCGFAVAGAVAAEEKLCARDRVLLAISWAGKAAFPPGKTLNYEAHEDLLEKLTIKAFYTKPVVAVPVATPPSSKIVPLSEIRNSLCAARSFADEDHSSTTWSSRSSLSSAASVASGASVASEEGASSAVPSVNANDRLNFLGIEVNFSQLLFS